MVLGPSKQDIMEYEKDFLKLEYMIKENKTSLSKSEEKMIQNVAYSRRLKELKEQILGSGNNNSHTNSRRKMKKRSRDSIFHPVDILRKSRSASHIGNKYTVPVPAIKHDQSPVVGFGYKKVTPNLKLLNKSHSGGPMELVRSLSRQSRKSTQCRERETPPQGWERHVHIDGSDFFVNKITKESLRKIPSAK